MEGPKMTRPHNNQQEREKERNIQEEGEEGKDTTYKEIVGMLIYFLSLVLYFRFFWNFS